MYVHTCVYVYVHCVCMMHYDTWAYTLYTFSFLVYSYGFSPAINAYRAFGFTCIGNENTLSDCQGSGAVCRTDDVDHALAVECGGSGPRKYIHVHITIWLHVIFTVYM